MASIIACCCCFSVFPRMGNFTKKASWFFKSRVWKQRRDASPVFHSRRFPGNDVRKGERLWKVFDQSASPSSLARAHRLYKHTRPLRPTVRSARETDRAVRISRSFLFVFANNFNIFFNSWEPTTTGDHSETPSDLVQYKKERTFPLFFWEVFSLEPNVWTVTLAFLFLKKKTFMYVFKDIFKHS